MSLVMVMAGGTGGHIFPALAVANELRERGVDVVWLGTRNGMEAKIVPQEGYPMEWISIYGLRGKGALGWVLSPIRILNAIIQSLAALRKTRPTSVLGMGGFIAGPGGVGAKLLGIPLIIHEQNAIAGLTNKLLSRLACTVLCGFPDVKGLGKACDWVGNPVRKPSSNVTREAPVEASRVLVTGGSLGATKINQIMPKAFALMKSEDLIGTKMPEIWHQTGINQADEVVQAYREAGIQARVDEFIVDMQDAYSWADLVIARAGAMTITEIAAAGLPSVLIPFPYAVGDHQTVNASYLSAAGAALLCRECDTDEAGLAKAISGLLQNPDQMLAIGKRATDLYKPDSASRIADACLVSAS